MIGQPRELRLMSPLRRRIVMLDRGNPKHALTLANLSKLGWRVYAGTARVDRAGWIIPGTDRVSFDIPAATYRTIAPLLEKRRITLPQMGAKLFEQLAAGVTAGHVPLIPPKPIVVTLPKSPPATRESRTQLPADAQRALVHMHTDGDRANTIAVELGCSVNTVGRYVDRLQMTPHPRGTRGRTLDEATLTRERDRALRLIDEREKVPT